MNDNDNFSPPLAGFETIKRFWDKRRGVIIAKILPGEFYVSTSKEVISTVLGSCISACIWDEMNGVGGMNHFLLPQRHNAHPDAQDASYTARYGNWAMEYLVNEVIKNGGTRNNLKAKIFGGGKIISAMTNDVGEGNVDFVLEYLKLENIPILANDTGGPWPRKVMFDPLTGRAQIKKLRSIHNDTVQRRERKYVHDIDQSETESNIELF
ncbi:MAG: chemotaxis protein CheD [Phenylobacterium sp.]|jgi:chemotaxis protein CheD